MIFIPSPQISTFIIFQRQHKIILLLRLHHPIFFYFRYDIISPTSHTPARCPIPSWTGKICAKYSRPIINCIYIFLQTPFTIFNKHGVLEFPMRATKNDKTITRVKYSELNSEKYSPQMAYLQTNQILFTNKFSNETFSNEIYRQYENFYSTSEHSKTIFLKLHLLLLIVEFK